MPFKGVIFDLDGVIVNTVPLHFKAWKRMFNEEGKEFTFEDYKKKVDGIPRIDGAKAILTNISHAKAVELGTKKQGYYLEYLEKEGVEVYPTTVNLIRQLREKGIKIAVISASKNCQMILERAGLTHLIDAIVDGDQVIKGKPDPEVFLRALAKIDLKAKECVVFEDALLGVEAAKRAKIFTIGIDRHHDSERLKKADLIVNDLGEIDYQKLKNLF